MSDRALTRYGTDAASEVLVRTCHPIWYAEQFVPDTHLEWRPWVNQGYRKQPQFTGEIRIELVLQRGQMLVFARNDRAGKKLLQRTELRFQHPAVCEFQKAYPPVIRCSDDGPQRTLDPRHHNAVHIAACSRRAPKRAHECVAESAVRLVTVAKRDVVQSCALSQLIQSITHPSRSAVGLKSHAIVFLEIPANAKRIDSRSAQFVVSDSFFGIID